MGQATPQKAAVLQSLKAEAVMETIDLTNKDQGAIEAKTSTPSPKQENKRALEKRDEIEQPIKKKKEVHFLRAVLA